MELEGRVWKDGKFWLVEVPILDAMTQGKSRRDALRMIEDAVTGLIESYFEDRMGEDLGVKAFLREDNMIGVTANDTKILLSLSLNFQVVWVYSFTIPNCSLSRVYRFLTSSLRTAKLMACLVPTKITSRFPRVIPV